MIATDLSDHSYSTDPCDSVIEARGLTWYFGRRLRGRQRLLQRAARQRLCFCRPQRSRQDDNHPYAPGPFGADTGLVDHARL